MEYKRYYLMMTDTGIGIGEICSNNEIDIEKGERDVRAKEPYATEVIHIPKTVAHALKHVMESSGYKTEPTSSKPKVFTTHFAVLLPTGETVHGTSQSNVDLEPENTIPIIKAQFPEAKEITHVTELEAIALGLIK